MKPLQNTNPFAEQLREAVATLGLPVLQVADRLKYPRRTFQDWYYANRIPPVYARAGILSAVRKVRSSHANGSVRAVKSIGWGRAQ